MNERERNTQARQEIFASIRRCLAESAPFDAARVEHQQALHPVHQESATRDAAAQTSVAAQTSAASMELSASGVALIERFRQALEMAGGHCFVARSVDEAASEIKRIIEATNARRVAVSNSSLVRRAVEHIKTDAVLIEDADAKKLFDCDVGITGAQWAIAETGTLVLESDAERHRLASLVPPVHIAIIEASGLRATLGEVLEAVSAEGSDRLSRTVTFITGPSRTSDIELTLAIGVHGPRELHVIMIDDINERQG